MHLNEEVEYLITHTNKKNKTKVRRLYQHYIRSNEIFYRVRNTKLHYSASAIVFKNNKIFFIKHPYLNKILLPAGHVEINEEPVETATREFHEETGFFAFYEQGKSALVDVNLIEIPENKILDEKAHQHIDFRYRLELAAYLPVTSELPCFLLEKGQAPTEFHSYFCN